MVEPLPTELNTQPEYRLLLAAYQQEEALARSETPEFSGWLPRLYDVADIDPALLSRLHGRLISFGYLQFHLGDRMEGIKYQLTPEATRLLSQQPEEDEQDNEAA